MLNNKVVSIIAGNDISKYILINIINTTYNFNKTFKIFKRFFSVIIIINTDTQITITYWLFFPSFRIKRI